MLKKIIAMPHTEKQMNHIQINKIKKENDLDNLCLQR